MSEENVTPEKQALNEILSEMAEDNPAVPCTDVTSPSAMTVPHFRKGKKKDKPVEVIPGIMVSQRLIDEAVKMTTNSLHPSVDIAEEARQRLEEARRQRIAKDNAELREDLDKSREVVVAMINRMREPMKYDEKFVSYDTMPGPLQRVVKAYIEAEEANRNLAEAVAALAGDLKPPAAKPE